MRSMSMKKKGAVAGARIAVMTGQGQKQEAPRRVSDYTGRSENLEA